MKRISFALCLISSFHFSIGFAQNNSSSCKCCTENHRQFDFWIGEWEVHDSSGTFLGNNTIQLLQDSCVLQENWTSAKNFTGTSLSFFNQRSKLWHQTWIDNSGGVIMMKGESEKGKVIMYTDKRYTDDYDKNVYVQNKTTWYPLDDGRVHHIWEHTKDGGKTWKVVFDGYYKRK